jgi:hypothetical protein
MKLSVREMLFLVLIVAMSLGWWLDHRRLLHANEIASSRLAAETVQVENLKFTLDLASKRVEYDRSHWREVRDRVGEATWDRVLAAAKEVTAERTARGENPYVTD